MSVNIETPNTRSRRKRELESALTSSNSQDDAGRITWTHDQGLRRAVMMAVQNTPPTPTQKPRPISSRLSPMIANSNAQASSSSSTYTSSNRPRKRPYRGSRSLPHVSSNNGDSSFSRSSSAPGLGKSSVSKLEKYGGDEQLGELLAQWDQFVASENASASGSGSSKIVPFNIVQKDTVGESGNNRTPLRTEHGTEQLQSRSISITTSDTRKDFSSSSLRPNDKSLLSPDKSQNGPRIGVSSNRNYSHRNSTNPAFKPPSFVNNRLPHPQATRSSPRRPANPTSYQDTAGNFRQKPYVIPPSPLRGPEPLAVVQRTPSRISTSNQQTRSTIVTIMNSTIRGKLEQTPTRSSMNGKTSIMPSDQTSKQKIAMADHNANVDIGQDEPEGDTSFDSFDGMFQEGGPDIDELLKTVDGSQ